ncbi:MAG: sugar ABC transporter ATP-binding protein [Alphaproteobacteria bacterium]
MSEQHRYGVADVSKAFGPVQALRGVSLDFPPGEVLALVGENGAGKSTLMRILEGEYQPDSGTVTRDGAPVALTGTADAHALGIRIIHQEPETVAELTVAENVFLGDFRRKGGLFVDWTDLEQRTLDLLRQFGVENELNPRRQCRHLGPAQRQLIEIMRALKSGVRLLALDEPTSSLTEDEAQRLFAVIRRMRDEGVAVIYISHRLHEIMPLADKVAVLRDGALIDVRPIADLDERVIAQLMVGRPVESFYQTGERHKGDVVLAVRGLTTEQVRDCSLEVRAGEVVGLGGLMGAGRTELAKGIFAFDRALAGQVLVNGTAIRLRSPADAILAGIGFAPEDRKHEALLMMRGVRENISLCVPDKISVAGFVRRSAETAIAARMVDRMQVKTPSLSQLVSKLSGGNQQKVVLGRWLARQPKVLILDEPTRGIDVGSKAEIYRLIEELAEGGMAILMISSEMPELLGVTDRILVMRDRTIVGELETARAGEDDILRLAMGEHLHRARAAS